MEYEGGAVKVLTDFTADRDLLQQTIQKLIVGEARDSGIDTTHGFDSFLRLSSRTIANSTSSTRNRQLSPFRPPRRCSAI